MVSNAGGHNTQLETILQNHSNKNFMVQAKNQEHQLNGIENSDKNPPSNTHLIFDITHKI
jgi:hypothetical protein